MSTGYWELGGNLQDCVFSCHLCGQGGFSNIQALDDHTMITCPNRDNDIDWGDPDEWLERSTVRSTSDVSSASFSNEAVADPQVSSKIDPTKDVSTAVAELKCPICFENKVALVSPCGHCFCHTCCAAFQEKEINSCPTCRVSWCFKELHPVFL